MACKLANGKIISSKDPTDTHLGRLTLEKLEIYKSNINQIELVDEVSETCESVRLRSIRVAQEMRKKGLKVGDVVLICAVNHNDIPLPVLACLYNGHAAMNLVTTFAESDYTHYLKISNPGIIFCDPEIAPTFQKACGELNLNIEIVVFGDASKTSPGCVNFASFLNPTGTESSFKVAEIDTKEAVAFLVCTSGTTGLSKCAAITHYSFVTATNLVNNQFDIKTVLQNEEDGDDKCVMAFSSLYWISGIYNMMWSIDIGLTKVHSKQPFSAELFAKALKNHNIKLVIAPPATVATVLGSPLLSEMDFTKIRYFFCGGSKMSETQYDRLQKLISNGTVMHAYGLSEAGGVITDDTVHKKESCGKMLPWFQWKLINPETFEDITAPNVPGELCVKSDVIFKEYLNNPEATRQIRTSDGFLKTGDILYYDVEGFFYVVDRFKLMFKYRNYQIVPTEIESVILEIPEILHCCVVGVPHPMDGEHPTAVIQFNEGAILTKEQVVEEIKDKLSDTQQLRGGIIYLDPMPLTPSGKINRSLLRNLVLTLYNIKNRL